MSKFIKNIVLISVITFILLCIYFVGSFFLVAEYDETSYLASILDKMERLERIEEPKIILVGDSNLAFGIDSAYIEEALGMPVVNLGLHGGLGNSFHEQMARYNINPGDIVVLAHTSYSQRDIDSNLVYETVAGQQELYACVPKELYRQMVKTLPSYTRNTWGDFLFQQDSVANPEQTPYARGAFNEYGDVVFPREYSVVDYSTGVSQPPEIDAINTDRINAFYEECQSKGATLVLAAYPIVNGHEVDPSESFARFQEELEAKMSCPVISDYTDYIMDYHYFYDTVYHLTDEGAQVRTGLLVEDLQVFIEEQGDMFFT